MKRDLDLVRAILLACEKEPHGYAPEVLEIDGYNDEQVGFHVYLMIQAGLLEGGDRTHLGSMSPQAIAQNLTWSGYEFLEASKNEDSWAKAKSAAAGVGGITLDVLKSVLTQLSVAGAKKALGLP